MFELWDYVNIIGIVLEICGFIILLSRFSRKITNLLNFIDFFLRTSEIDTAKILDYEKLTKPKIPEEVKNKILGFWESIGIILVIIGLIGQIAAILIEKISN